LQLKIKEHQSELVASVVQHGSKVFASLLADYKMMVCDFLFIHSERGLDCPSGTRDSICVVVQFLEVVSLDRERMLLLLLLLFKEAVAVAALDSMLRASPRTADCDFE
jgi:hypothetical protein